MGVLRGEPITSAPMSHAGVPGPVAPVPDEKDWTWAIGRSCPECGFDPGAVQHDEVAPLTLAYTAALRRSLLRPDAGERPAATVWSPLEYACHVRDVCELFDRRLSLMLSDDDPRFDNWDQDATAIEQQYWLQEPVVVEQELTHRATEVAARFGGVSDEQWQRPGRRSNGSVFTVHTFALYFLHDLAHHAWDVAPGSWA